MKIPVKRTTVSADGTETTDTVEFSLLPPAPGKCGECGREHDNTEPHDPTTLFYRMKFQMIHNRPPTWADAMQHCSPQMQAAWTEGLASKGIDVNSTDLTGKIV